MTKKCYICGDIAFAVCDECKKPICYKHIGEEMWDYSKKVEISSTKARIPIPLHSIKCRRCLNDRN